jgi:hypothetical protein
MPGQAGVFGELAHQPANKTGMTGKACLLCHGAIAADVSGGNSGDDLVNGISERGIHGESFKPQASSYKENMEKQ